MVYQQDDFYGSGRGEGGGGEGELTKRPQFLHSSQIPGIVIKGVLNQPFGHRIFGGLIIIGILQCVRSMKIMMSMET